MAGGAGPCFRGLHSGSLSFEACPFPQQVAVDGRKNVADTFDAAAVGFKFCVQVRIVSFGGDWFLAQARARAH